MNSQEVIFHYSLLGIFVAGLIGLSIFFSRQPKEKKEKLFKGILGLLSISTLILIFVGAMVASTRSGMAFMDWPTSNGLIWPSLDKWIHQKDMFWEHIHRLIAEGVGYLAICTLIWSFFVHNKKYTKAAALLLIVIIIQGIFGGLTVKRLTAWWTSSLHGVVAQLVFCLMVVMYLSSSQMFSDVQKKVVGDSWLTRLPVIVCGVVLIQLLLGASFRHKMKVSNFASEINEAHVIGMAADKTKFVPRQGGDLAVKVKLSNPAEISAELFSETELIGKISRKFDDVSSEGEFVTLGHLNVEADKKYRILFEGNVQDVHLVNRERIDLLTEDSKEELKFTIVYKEVLDGNRHLLWSHVGFAIVVTVLVLLLGMYLLKKDHGIPTLTSLGKYMLISLIIQLLLGLIALLTVSERQRDIYDQFKTILTSAHLANGAVLLAFCVLSAYVCRKNFSYSSTAD